MGSPPRALRDGRGFRAVAIGALAVGGAWLLYQCLTLEVRYYDSYDYLNDARALLGDADSAYYGVHSPLLPILAIPSAWAWSPESPSRVAWWVPHLTAGLLTAFAVFATHRLVRRLAGARWALAGACVVAASPVVVHYGPHLLTDIPAMGLCALGLALFDRHVVQPRVRVALALGVTLGLAVAMKFSLAALPIAIAAVCGLRLADHVVRSRAGARRLFGHYALVGIVAAITFGVLVWLRYTLPADSSFTMEAFSEDLRFARQMVEAIADESPSDYLIMLPQALGWPAFLLAFAGPFALAARVGLVRTLAPALFIVAFVGSMVASVGMTQIRYMLPIAPVLVAFAMATVGWLGHPPRPRWFETVAAATVFGTSLFIGAQQVVRDSDPFYRMPIQREIAEAIIDHLPADGTVYWAGHFVTLTPSDPIVFPKDEYFSFFHLGHPAIRFLTHRPVVGTHPAAGRRRVATDPRPSALVIGPGRFHHAADLQAGHPLPRTFTFVIRVGDDAVERVFPATSDRPF